LSDARKSHKEFIFKIFLGEAPQTRSQFRTTPSKCAPIPISNNLGSAPEVDNRAYTGDFPPFCGLGLVVDEPGVDVWPALFQCLAGSGEQSDDDGTNMAWKLQIFTSALRDPGAQNSRSCSDKDLWGITVARAVLIMCFLQGFFADLSKIFHKTLHAFTPNWS
jgi:hypothetical protein